MAKALSESLLLDLVGRIYEAACEPDAWPEFLETFAEAVRGESTQVLHYDVEHHQGNLTATARLDPWFKARYDEHFGALDPWGAHGRHLMTTGNVVTGQMLCPDSILIKSEFYQDFMRHVDAFHQFCGFIYKGDSAFSLISTLRPLRKGPFGDDAVQLLSALMPHLQRALQLHRKIVGLQRRADSAANALDRLPAGFLAMDQQGHLILLNQRAADILALGDGLILGRNGLITRRREETARLELLIRGALSTASGQATPSGGTMLVSRPSRRRPFQVLVTPLGRASSVWPEHATAGIFITDPEAEHDPPEHVLQRLFGLTPAEARLARFLMEGKSLPEAAEAFHLSRNTVRTQLRSIFDKTSTKRQSELVRLLYRSPAQLRTR